MVFCDHMVIPIEMAGLISRRVFDGQHLSVSLEEGEAGIAHIDEAEFTLEGIDHHVGVEVSARIVYAAIVIEFIY